MNAVVLFVSRPNPLPGEREFSGNPGAAWSILKLTKSSPYLLHRLRHLKFPLLWERVRVRGNMSNDQLQTAETRLLRQNLVPAEQALWGALRNRQFLGLKFRRQAPIGPHIVDFLCMAERLILEIDSLAPPPRAAWLAPQGYRIARLSPQDILTDLPRCLQQMAKEFTL